MLNIKYLNKKLDWHSVNKYFQNVKFSRQVNINEDSCPRNESTDETTIDSIPWEEAKPFKEMPGPKALPLLGNTWRYLPGGEYAGVQNDVCGYFKTLNNKFGEIVKVEKIIGRGTEVHLYNPVDVELIYKLEGKFPERDILPSISYFRENMRQDIFKNAKGLLTSQGEEWYDFRNKVNSIMMQPKMVKQYVKPINTITQELIEKLRKNRTDDNKYKDDLLKELNKWSLESIAYIAVHKKLNCLSENITPDSIQYKLIKLTEDIFIVSGNIDFRPSIWKYFPTPLYKKAMSLYNEQATVGIFLINEAKRDIEKNANKHGNSDDEPSVLEKLLNIDPKVAAVMALDMLLAGVNTTSSSLINILYFLSTNTEAQNTLRSEIKSTMGNASDISAEHLNSMPYLKASIREAARLYPVTPGTFRVLTKDRVIRGYQVPKGSNVIFPHMYLGVMEKHFYKAQEYIPDRWLRDQSDPKLSYKSAHPFCAMHFGFGSRSCIGRRFAELELEIAVTHIVKNFHLTWNGPPPKRITTTLNYLKGPFGFTLNDI